MAAKALSSGAAGSKVHGGVRIGDGDANRPPTRREFEQLERVIEELESRVAQDRRDLDMQFQRLAQLQAVIDRMQIAAKNVRPRRAASSG